MRALRPLLAAGTFALACCAPPPPAPTPPPPRPAATPTPTPAPIVQPPPAPENWMDAPQTPGDWYYKRQPGSTMASFGPPQSEAIFHLRCDLATRRIALARSGSTQGAAPMRILTETSERLLTAQPSNGELPLVGVTLSASDPLLDAMAFSKGRFAVETGGMPTLYLPSWTEVTRVIEDCR